MRLERYWLTLVSLILLAISILSSTTPIWWRLSGKGEQYPEIVIAIYCVPTAAFLLAYGVAILILGHEARGGASGAHLKWIWRGAITAAISGGAMLLGLFLPSVPSPLRQLILNVYPLIAYPVDLLLLIVGVAAALRSTQGGS